MLAVVAGIDLAGAMVHAIQGVLKEPLLKFCVAATLNSCTASDSPILGSFPVSQQNWAQQWCDHCQLITSHNHSK